MRLQGLGAGYGVDSGLAIEAKCDGALSDVILVAECLNDQETSGNACEFTAVGALRVGWAGDDVDGDDTVISV